MKVLALAIGFAVLVGGCRVSTASESAMLQVATDGSAFDRGASIDFAVLNIGSSDAFVAACGGRLSVDVERRQSGEWTA